MIDPAHYRYSVQWSPRDEEFVGTVAEFPSVSWLNESELEAFAGIQRITADIVTEMVAAGETPPIPLAERKYSGKFVVRIPPELHLQLATEAAEHKVSLNRLVSIRLASGG